MADTFELVKWSGKSECSFYLKSNEIRGVKDITISSSLDTEDQTADGEKYTKKKNKGSYQITLTAVLNAALGVDVQKVATAMTEAARGGSSGYFYMATKKLFPSKFMATDAKITNLCLTRKGEWSYAEVEFTLKQASKYDGSTGSSGGGGGGGGDGGGGGGGGGGYKYSVTVYYSGSSGAVSSVTGYSNVSKEDARKKAWAKVPGNAQWASETPKQATNQTPAKTTTTTVTKTVTNAVKTAVNTVKNVVSNVLNTLSAAKQQSNKVMQDANTKKTTTTTTVTKPAVNKNKPTALLK